MTTEKRISLGNVDEDEYYAAAFAAAEGSHTERRLLRRQEQLRQAWQQMTEGLQALPDGQQSREQHNKSVDLERQIDELSKQIRAARNELASAESKLHDTINGGARHLFGVELQQAKAQAKKAVVKLATKLEPKAAECAACLGRLYLRTPDSFIAMSILEGRQGNAREAGARSRNRQKQERRLLPETNASSLSSWELYEHIESLANAASSQHAESILMLMSILTTVEQGSQAAEFLFRMVSERWTQVEKVDAARCERVKRACAVTAWWPYDTADPRTALYANLMVLLENPSMDDETRVQSKLLPRRTSSQLTFDTDPDSMKRSLATLDDAYSEALRLDPLLYVCPEVVEVLEAISRRNVVQLRADEEILYGEEEQHWVERRKAAGRICRLACAGNVLACIAIVEKLLSDSHWAVRQLSVHEAAHLIELFHESAADMEDQQLFASLVTALVEIVLIPGENLHEYSPEQAQQVDNVRETAEKALVTVLKEWKQDLRDYVAMTLNVFCVRHSSSKKNALRANCDRIFKAVGIDGTQVPQKHYYAFESTANADQPRRTQTLRKDRQRAAELDSVGRYSREQ